MSQNMIGTERQSQAPEIAPAPRRPWLVALGLLGIGLLVVQVLSITIRLGPPATDQAIGDWTYRALMVGAALVVFTRAALLSRDRLAWALIGTGLAAWTAGDFYYAYALADGHVIPYPSLSDALYFADYVALIAGVLMLGARRRGTSVYSLGLVVSVLGLATVWSWIVFGDVIAGATGGTAAVATTLAYPLLDLFLLASMLVALAARDWKFDRVLVCLAAGFAVGVLADSIYAVRVADATYVDGTLLDALWPAGVMLIAAAAWLRPALASSQRQSADSVFPVITSTAIAIAIGALIFDHFWRLDSLTILLSGMTLAVGCSQLALLYRGRTEAIARALRSESVRSASTRAALDCVVSIDSEGRVREWNEAATRTFGYGPDEVVGRELAELIIPPALRAQHRAGLSRFLETGETHVLNRRIEITGMHAGGGEFPIELAVTQVSDDPLIFTGFIRDIGDRKAREAENERLAAIVRSSEDAMISKDLAGAVTAWNHGAELLYGYSPGEAIGTQLSSLIVPVERVDEPGMLIDELSDHKVAAFETQRRRKNGELVTVSMRAFAVRDLAGEITGVSTIAHDITDRKRREDRERDDRDATLWRGRIEAALDEDRLLFFGQPIVNLDSGAVDHQELLIRMELDGEVVSPGAFLPHAEKTELIKRVDRWAVAQGIELARSGRVAINLSGKSLDDADLSAWIEEALADRKLAENVIFEITETAAASNLDAAQRLVTQLTGLGCGVALDDFGTGYGSFTYLKRLPITELKIDMEFIRGLSSDPQSQRVVKSIVSAAELFDVKTVAEGVEDEETLDLLRVLGVDMAQGFFVGYPSRIPRRPGPAGLASDPAPTGAGSLAAGKPGPGDPGPDSQLEQVRGLFAAIASGDPESLLASIHPEVEWTPTVWSGPTARGHQGVREWMRRFGEGLNELEIELQTLERHGDRVLALGTVIDGRGEEPFALRVGWVFSFRDGLIVRGRAYPDWAATRAAVAGPATSPAVLVAGPA